MSLNQVAYDHIRRLLATGRVGVNHSISEPELARELGISRTPVREAMKQLAREGMIEQFHGVGTFLRIPDRHELVHMLEMRETLEVAAARKAAERRTARDLEMIRKQQQRMSAASKQIRTKKLTTMPPEIFAEMVDADQLFHHAIIEATQNPLYAKALDTFHVLTRTMSPAVTVERADLVEQVGRSDSEHAGIANAIREQDAEAAAKLMSSHIRWATETMMAAFDSGKALREQEHTSTPAHPESAHRQSASRRAK